MQTITTRYHGPGNGRGSRISARALSGTIYVPYDHTLDLEDNHRAAAVEYANRLEWLEGTPERPTAQRMELITGTDHKGDRVHVLRAVG